jgi:hypothetical protein
MEAEKDLLNYGKYAARLPMAVEKVSIYMCTPSGKRALCFIGKTAGKQK